MEFGVVDEDGEPKAYGAGILSSVGELEVFQQAHIPPIDLAEMGTRDYDITRYQPVLYSATSFGALCAQVEDSFSNYDDAAYQGYVRARQ